MLTRKYFSCPPTVKYSPPPPKKKESDVRIHTLDNVVSSISSARFCPGVPKIQPVLIPVNVLFACLANIATSFSLTGEEKINGELFSENPKVLLHFQTSVISLKYWTPSKSNRGLITELCQQK